MCVCLSFFSTGVVLSASSHSRCQVSTFAICYHAHRQISCGQLHYSMKTLACCLGAFVRTLSLSLFLSSLSRSPACPWPCCLFISFSFSHSLLLSFYFPAATLSSGIIDATFASLPRAVFLVSSRLSPAHIDSRRLVNVRRHLSSENQHPNIFPQLKEKCMPRAVHSVTLGHIYLEAFECHSRHHGRSSTCVCDDSYKSAGNCEGERGANNKMHV